MTHGESNIKISKIQVCDSGENEYCDFVTSDAV